MPPHKSRKKWTRKSQQIFDSISSKIRKTTKLNQWKNTSDITNWFTSITDMQKHSFASFDIYSFYPSITESLLSKAISFAKNYTTISDKHIDIIMHYRKSLLFDNETAWTKKNHNRNYGQLRRSGSLWACRSFPPEQPQWEIRQKQGRTLQRRRTGTSKKHKRTPVNKTWIGFRIELWIGSDRIRLQIGSDRAGSLVLGAELLETLRKRSTEGRGRQKLIVWRANLIREQFDAFAVCDYRPPDVHDMKTTCLRFLGKREYFYTFIFI